jgi:prepilin-type N-terminal cleavage/methylation domain-containing protein
MESGRSWKRASGYTLIELLVVLVIVGILAIASVQMIGNRPASAVHGVMDQLEGVIAAAHKGTTATLGDITLTATGNWTTATPATLTYTGASGPGDNFVFTPTSRDHQYAGVDCGSGWSDNAIASLVTFPPFSTDPNFKAALGSSGELFKTGTAVINGYSKRANTGFYIAVVGLRGGVPIDSGPVGVLVMPAGSGTVYKFFRTNSAEPWRRL